MSFHTSLLFYRPAKPPLITGTQLGEFVDRLRSTHTLLDSGWRTLSVKFGRSIDSDNSPAVFDVPIAPQLSRFESIDWDIDFRASGIQEIVDRLTSASRQVYRAAISLGDLRDDVIAAIQRRNSPENDIDLLLHELGFDLGPVELHQLGNDCVWEVGWMSLSISGPGYLFPWAFRDVVARLESSALVGQITDVCRLTWPVTPLPVTAEAIAQRREAGELWPYGDLAKPCDWYWGVAEA